MGPDTPHDDADHRGQNDVKAGQETGIGHRRGDQADLLGGQRGEQQSAEQGKALPFRAVGARAAGGAGFPHGEGQKGSAAARKRTPVNRTGPMACMAVDCATKPPPQMAPVISRRRLAVARFMADDRS
jgi:hypothetical protein